MKTIVVFLFWFSVLNLPTHAQRFVLKSGRITVSSETSIENIEAKNDKATSVFNPENGDIAFSVPNNQFKFKKKLMEEHFNEKYMESEKYPRSSFTGRLEGFGNSSGEKQSIKAVGKLSIHGVSRDVTIPGTVWLLDKEIRMTSIFIVRLVDFDIKIPQLLWQNIAEEIEVTVDFTYRRP